MQAKYLTKVFISAPIALDPNYIENFKRLESLIIEKFKREQEYNQCLQIINPVINIVNGERENYIRESIKMLINCDVVVFAKNYEIAKGCKFERLVAEECGITIIDEEDLVKI